MGVSVYKSPTKGQIKSDKQSKCHKDIKVKCPWSKRKSGNLSEERNLGKVLRNVRKQIVSSYLIPAVFMERRFCKFFVNEQALTNTFSPLMEVVQSNLTAYDLKWKWGNCY